MSLALLVEKYEWKIIRSNFMSLRTLSPFYFLLFFKLNIVVAKTEIRPSLNCLKVI